MLEKINRWDVIGFLIIPAYYLLLYPNLYGGVSEDVIFMIYSSLMVLIYYLALRLRKSNPEFSRGITRGLLAWLFIFIALSFFAIVAVLVAEALSL